MLKVCVLGLGYVGLPVYEIYQVNLRLLDLIFH